MFAFIHGHNTVFNSTDSKANLPKFLSQIDPCGCSGVEDGWGQGDKREREIAVMKARVGEAGPVDVVRGGQARERFRRWSGRDGKTRAGQSLWLDVI